QPVLNAFPLPNGADLGDGMAEFIGSWSNPRQLDSVSARFDQSVHDKLKLFFRSSNTTSSATDRGTGSPNSVPANMGTGDYTNRTYTMGANSTFSPRVNNDLRLNYSSNEAVRSSRIGSFGGGQAVDLAQLQGISPASGTAYAIVVSLPDNAGLVQSFQSGKQRQWNLVDAMSMSLGAHQLKFGADYRR